MKMSTNINEGMGYKSLTGLISNIVHIDEFASKMGDDDDICVLSFRLPSDLSAADLVSWFEKGYDFVLDADKSPGEVSVNVYLVYLELRRRSSLVDQINTLLDDLQTLTEFELEDWECKVGSKNFTYSKSNIEKYVPLSPKAYRFQREFKLNELRVRAGMTTQKLFTEQDSIIREYKSKAGL